MFIRPPYGLDCISGEGQSTVDDLHVVTDLSIADSYHRGDLPALQVIE